MIREPNYNQISIEEFKTPFELGLDKTNRWVFLASCLPWNELTRIYSRALKQTMGRPAIRARVAIGAMIIKHKLRLPDEEVIPTIQENPYLQFFLGYSEFSHKRPFDPSLFVTIRKRLGADMFNEMTDKFLSRVSEIENKNKIKKEKKKKNDNPSKSSSPDSTSSESFNNSSDENKRSGMLLLDASVAPADIKYPTDLDLLNTCREQSEKLIDQLWQKVKTPEENKPRTYRRVARKSYLNMSKKRKKKSKELRKALRKQLNFIKRNFKTINTFLDRFDTKQWPLDFSDLRIFWIIQEVYRQQYQMYNNRTHKISDRIVSISQPHVRPMVRGKASKEVEFGAKISASVVDGYAFLDRLSWDAYHEASDLPKQVMLHKARFGFYPEVVITDGLYGTRKNRAWLEKRNIRFSGKPLGRPPKITLENADQIRIDQRQRKIENCIRSRIEGKFGEGKRGYNLDLVKAKLPQTSESWVATIFFVMNIARWLRDYFFVLVLFLKKSKSLRLYLYAKEQLWANYQPI